MENNDLARSKAALLDAIRQGASNLAEACHMANIDYFSASQWLEDDSGFRGIWHHRLAVARERALDMAESVVNSKISKGDVNAARFMLATQGRARGYGSDEPEKARQADVNYAELAKKIAFAIERDRRLKLGQVTDVTPQPVLVKKRD